MNNNTDNETTKNINKNIEALIFDAINKIYGNKEITKKEG